MSEHSRAVLIERATRHEYDAADALERASEHRRDAELMAEKAAMHSAKAIELRADAATLAKPHLAGVDIGGAMRGVWEDLRFYSPDGDTYGRDFAEPHL